MSARLLIIEDDPEIASALVRGLGLHGYDAEAENRADRALDRLQSGGYAGAIIDVMLGADSGLDLVRDARARGVQIPILMLSALAEVDHRMAGLEAGADDYVVKPFTFEELVARLRVQERRVSAQRPEPARLDPATRELRCDRGSTIFTEREFDLLSLLLARRGEPMPRGEVFDALWQAEGSSNENVVDVYVGYLRKKLSAHDFGFEIKTIRHQGFCVEGLLPVIEADDAATKV
jgi:DNA-binding response OmpR family regulator